jgi:hypothetical protein
MFGAFRAKTTEMIVLSIRVDTIARRAAVNSESASCKDCVKLAIDPRRPHPSPVTWLYMLLSDCLPAELLTRVLMHQEDAIHEYIPAARAEGNPRSVS